MTSAETLALKNTCPIKLGGHRAATPAESYARMAEWCAQHEVEHDVYGEGALAQDFEHKIASLLGMESGLFCITGTMTQVTCLRLACEERNNRLVALHPSSHILLHERSNFQTLEHFTALRTGQPYRPWILADLQAHSEALAAVQIELPMREIGGQLPDWDELEAIKQYCKQRNIHLHMDGARLWEAAAAYGKTLAEIAAGYDTVYVSFYKGMAGLGGAMLLGNADFLARTRVWMHRLGGSVFRRSPYIVSAAMQFDARLAAMPACFARTKELYALLAEYPHFTVNPTTPQSNMLHLYLPITRQAAQALRDRIAREHGIWLFNQAVDSALPQQCMFEWYVGDQLVALDDELLRRALDLFADAIEQAA